LSVRLRTASPAVSRIGNGGRARAVLIDRPKLLFHESPIDRVRELPRGVHQVDHIEQCTILLAGLLRSRDRIEFLYPAENRSQQKIGVFDSMESIDTRCTKINPDT
jgi:hypothetical protein